MISIIVSGILVFTLLKSRMFVFGGPLTTTVFISRIISYTTISVIGIYYKKLYKTQLIKVIKM